ncbi:MAG TPA: SusC/RagA family TonB-linked outer membrane protein, partial [Chitinophagaceae bacterium]|nr:SusC/RagA family TonB-linked outer membrane protein [Chitinophagaceae bacterium]
MSKIYCLPHCFKFVFTATMALICLLTSARVFAQQSVSGTVKDAGGAALPGATVSVRGSSQTTSTDAAGAFRITLPPAASTLVVSYVGYLTQEVPVGTRTTISIVLQSGTSELAQVVVVGYGTQNKKDITGSVKSLKSEAFNRGIINSPQQLLQGKVSGVNVTSASGEPGAVTGITVRGPGGVRTGSTPLFVVDGLPLDNSSTGGGDPLNFINPQDIESIDVLKDASATAIYGARGANGVIIITTKRGRAGLSTLGFSSSVGVSTLARKLPVFTANEFRIEVPKAGGVLDDKGGSTDWQEEAIRTAVTQNYNLNLSGGANKLSYFASLGVQRQEGIIKKNDLNRYSGRFNVTQKFIDDRLVLDLNLNVANTKQERPPITSVLGDVITYNPTYPAYDASGKPAVYQNINPLLYFDLDKEITTINRVIGNISPSFKLIKGLVYKLNFGIDNSTSTRDVLSLPSTVPFRDGRLETVYNWNRNTLVENYLTYTWNNSRHNVSALAGHSYQKIFVQQRNSSINRFVVGGVDPIYNPGVGQLLDLANNRPGGFAFNNELQSFFGRVTYQFNNKYLFTANFRADGSSKFGENNKYGYFPSFSVGWKISDENFLKNSVFSNLKLRAGWGLTGNQEIPPKITQALFTSLGAASYPLYPAAGAYPAGYAYTRLANPDIRWESSEQTDIGLDFGLFNGALSGTIDLFRKVSNNILLQVIPADPVQPATDVWSNVEDMTITNKGAEFELEYRHKPVNGYTWSIGGNITYLTNKVENSPYSLIPAGSVSGAGITSSTINGYVNGQPIGTFFLKEFTGFDGAGLSTYRDLDGNGVINDNDRIAAGTALPNVMYNFYGNTAYKGFDLSVNFNGVAGNKIYNYTENVSFSKLRLAKNVNATRESIADAKESLSNATPVTSRYLSDGAYLRLNNVSLAYNFNTKS